jgi:hypothetical protein
MRGLKILVVAMGIMLVGGFATLIAVIAGRVTQRQAVPVFSQPFTAAPIDLPAGAGIEAIGVGGDRLVIDLVLPDGNRQVLILDLATGRRIGTIPLRSPP